MIAPTPQPIPPLLSLKSAAATRPNLHSLNSWPAVQCNEGFCNASEGQRLPLTTTMASQKPHHTANRGALISANTHFVRRPPMYIKDGRLRPLAVKTAKRSEALPDLPTVRE